MKFYIKTFGCRTNIAESEELKERLRKFFPVATTAATADFIIIRACAVTSGAEQGVRQTIRNYQRRGKQVFVIGCFLKKISAQDGSAVRLSSPSKSSGGKRNPNLIILAATFQLKKGDRNEMQKTIKDYTRERLESNPSGFSAGCFFKNPGWEEVGNKNEIIAKFPELEQFSEKPKISAGFLIDYLGLKGKKVEDVAVSEKHSNFILNLGNATAEQVIILRDLIKERAHSRYGFDLEEEVVLVGL